MRTRGDKETVPGPFSEGGANKALCKKNNGRAKDTFPKFPLAVMEIFGPNTMASFLR